MVAPTSLRVDKNQAKFAPKVKPRIGTRGAAPRPAASSSAPSSSSGAAAAVAPSSQTTSTENTSTTENTQTQIETPTQSTSSGSGGSAATETALQPPLSQPAATSGGWGDESRTESDGAWQDSGFVATLDSYHEPAATAMPVEDDGTLSGPRDNNNTAESTSSGTTSSSSSAAPIPTNPILSSRFISKSSRGPVKPILRRSNVERRGTSVDKSAPKSNDRPTTGNTVTATTEESTTATDVRKVRSSQQESGSSTTSTTTTSTTTTATATTATARSTATPAAPLRNIQQEAPAPSTGASGTYAYADVESEPVMVAALRVRAPPKIMSSRKINTPATTNESSEPVPPPSPEPDSRIRRESVAYLAERAMASKRARIEEGEDGLLSPEPESHHQRGKKKKEQFEPEMDDIPRLTLKELIECKFENGKGSARGSQLAKAKRTRGETPSPPDQPEQRTETPAPEAETPQASVAASSAAPRLRIVDGQIQVDVDSLVVENQDAEDSRNLENMEIVDEGDKYVTSASYRKKFRMVRWTAEQTKKFYEGLSYFGTDFTLIALMLCAQEYDDEIQGSWRVDRKHVKMKFNYEERIRPKKVNVSLLNRQTPAPEIWTKMRGELAKRQTSAPPLPTTESTTEDGTSGDAAAGNEGTEGSDELPALDGPPAGEAQSAVTATAGRDGQPPVPTPPASQGPPRLARGGIPTIRRAGGPPIIRSASQAPATTAAVGSETNTDCSSMDVAETSSSSSAASPAMGGMNSYLEVHNEQEENSTVTKPAQPQPTEPAGPAVPVIVPSSMSGSLITRAFTNTKKPKINLANIRRRNRPVGQQLAGTAASSGGDAAASSSSGPTAMEGVESKATGNNEGAGGTPTVAALAGASGTTTTTTATRPLTRPPALLSRRPGTIRPVVGRATRG
ncbi:Transcription factor TFIIIB component B [Quaeritorhiza haematococci]|nr:Transcription factor TFIIIB component B [Quaeritorhiza haematococci]